MNRSGPAKSGAKADEVESWPPHHRVRSNAHPIEHRAYFPVLPFGFALLVAAVNPGTGWFSGLYVALAVGSLALLLQMRVLRWSGIDLLALAAVVVVGASPYWHAESWISSSPSRGAVSSIVLFLGLRATVTDRARFLALTDVCGVIGTGYAVYFLGNASQYDRATTRQAIEFANANYTGAVLAFTIVCTIFLLRATAPATSFRKLLWTGSALIQSYALYETGSRSSFAGAFLGVLALLLGRRLSTKAYRLNGAILSILAFAAFIPRASDIFLFISSRLQSIGTFQRDSTSIDSLSGRAEIWREVQQSWKASPFLGWGPGQYYQPAGGDADLVAHSWALEYLASVGIVGAGVVGLIIGWSYCVPAIHDSGIGRSWVLATSLALAPNLALSTHQWTAWAWAGFALWSVSASLEKGAVGDVPGAVKDPIRRSGDSAGPNRRVHAGSTRGPVTSVGRGYPERL